MRSRLSATNTEAVLPSTLLRKVPNPYKIEAHAARNLIERAVRRLIDGRRIATRYEKITTNFAATIAIAAIILWWT